MTAVMTTGLTKYYGKTRGIEDLDLSVTGGEIFGFIGPNGAGKSTTIRLLMQLLRPTAGRITVLGTEVTGDNPGLRRRLGYLPAEINYYRNLTGRQLLSFAARAYGVDNLRAIDAYAETFDLDLSKRVRSYSFGNRKKLAIIQSLLHQPELLVLDEPTSGLDPLMQKRFFEILADKNARGMTIFLSSHVLSEVERFCHRVGFIREGRLIQVSRVEDIPGRSLRIVEVTFAEPGNLIGRLGLRAIDSDVTFRDGVHVFHVRGELHRALHLISEHPLADILVKQPTLEDLFLDLYAKEEEVH